MASSAAASLMRRAAALAIAAPVVGVMLHATSDMAHGAPSQGRERALARARAQGATTLPADAPTAPEGTPQEGGTFTVGTNEEPDTLNPYLTQLVTGSDITTGIMDTLMRYDSTQALIPTPATEFSVSDDGLTYTFTLREGVKFHNGDAFGPQDVIDTWTMIMNPDFAAFSTLGWDKITELTSPDEKTVVMVTNEVFAPFVSYVGADPSSAISPVAELAAGPEKFKSDFGRTKLIGTGPVKFGKWTPKQQISLDKNADYWGEAPKLDQVIVRFLPDDNTQLVQLQTGEVQAAIGSGSLGSLRVDEALAIPGIVVLEHPSPGGATWTSSTSSSCATR